MIETRFAPGTFTPDPRPSTVAHMLAAQYGLELKLLLRNGEQLLLTLFIPVTLLVGLTLLPLGSFGSNRADTFVPAIMALAVISTAFTGQAIAVAFDRRYGALKRLGATPLPVWGIIAGKSLAVVTVVFLQAIILGGIGFGLGWRPNLVGLLLGAAVIALGTAGFAALGLLLGGTLKAEIVLAVANLLWFVFAGLGALTLGGGLVPHGVEWVARLTPSGALTEALSQAMVLSVDWFGFVVLAVWGCAAALAALRWFRFT
ncbi:MAG TPA: ABC transporter permease [Mycobacterium sp.]|jgi:ABC-2 type transport system permease protein